MDEGSQVQSAALSIFFQVPNASLSLIASSLIAIMAALPRNGGLSTPYRRIIFGLSISDILQSFSLLLGPWMVPPSDVNPWGVGNKTSCQANGFLMSLGGGAVMMYTPSLCLYYLCKLRLRMTNDDFYYKFERKIHFFIILFNLSIAFMALGTDVFHANAELRSFCLYASTPTGCRYEPDVAGECDRESVNRVNFFLITMFIVLPFLSLMVIIVTMVLIRQHVWAISALNLHGGSTTSLRNNSRRRLEDEEQGAEDQQPQSSHDEVNPTETPREQLRLISSLYRQETAIQMFCYVGAFILIYFPLVIITAIAIFGYYSRLFSMIAIFLYPLGGLLNIMVYTRPMVASLRRSYPECSRIRAFWLVVKSGGKEPDEVEPWHHCCYVPPWMYSDYEYSSGDYDSRWKSSFGIHLSRIGF